jgi:hypothetical protein
MSSAPGHLPLCRSSSANGFALTIVCFGLRQSARPRMSWCHFAANGQLSSDLGRNAIRSPDLQDDLAVFPRVLRPLRRFDLGLEDRMQLSSVLTHPGANGIEVVDRVGFHPGDDRSRLDHHAGSFPSGSPVSVWPAPKRGGRFSGKAAIPSRWSAVKGQAA